MTVFYADANELATLANTFSVNSVPTDPTTVSLIVTDPLGVQTTYTYGAAQITKTGTGAYSKDISSPTPGLWSYVWVGTGSASDAVAGTWFVTDPTSRLYVSMSDLKLALGGMTDTSRDELLEVVVRAAARGIDRYCGRRFYADGTATARTYSVFAQRGRLLRKRTGETLLVDDISTASGLVVELGSTAAGFTALTDYVTEPDTALVEGLPITSLRRDFGFWGLSPRAQVRVTAKWGWPAVPDNVTAACLLQASRLYRRKDSPQGFVGSADWGAMRVSNVDPDVRELLSPYKLPGFGGF